VTPRQDIAAVAAQIGSTLLADNRVWVNRFQIKSQTSDSRYTIAQRRSDKVWGCSCIGWRHHRKCKHVTDVLCRLAALVDRAATFAPEVAQMLAEARTAYLDIDVKPIDVNITHTGREIDL